MTDTVREVVVPGNKFHGKTGLRTDEAVPESSLNEFGMFWLPAIN